MTPKRLVYSIKPITPERGMELWKAEVDARMQDLSEALAKPIPTDEGVYDEVGPEDPRYKQAHYETSYNAHPLVFKTPLAD